MLERAVANMELEMSGMRKERIQGADGTVWEALARNAGTFDIQPSIGPFRLSAATANGNTTFTVDADYSTVTDGTNGNMINLAGVGLGAAKPISASNPFVVLKADIDVNLQPTAWSLIATNDPNEVDVTSSTQIGARLYIGKVVFNGNAATAVQAVFAPQRLTYGFLNGILVRVFESAPVHPDYVVPN